MIRKILKVESETISISIPKSYLGKMLEIIAFSKDEGLTREISEKKKPTFNALSLNTVCFKFNRDEANERSRRISIDF